MPVTTYRYLFADLLTNQVLAELNLTGVTFTQSLNAAGTFQGSIELSGLPASANATNATIPAKCAVYVDRNGVLVWGGIIWNRTYNSQTQHLSITAREFESYFERRRITTTSVFSSVDQFTIAQQLVNNAQAATNGNVGIAVPSNTSGVLVSRTYYSYELKTVYSALLDLSRSTNGFDFNIKVAYDGGGNPSKSLILAYPQSGIRYSASNPTATMFELPAGNMVEYEYPEDGAPAANTVYVIGAGSNEGKQIVTATDATKIAAGWPLLEDSANYSDYTDLTLLTNFAAGQVAAVSYPPTTLKVVASPSVDPVFGTYGIGDDVRIRITDDRFPAGIDTTYRLVALSLAAGENGPERVTLTLSLPTS
jgi:hypothetical protein